MTLRDLSLSAAPGCFRSRCGRSTCGRSARERGARLALAGLAAACLLLASGCATLRLRPELKEAQTMQLFTGTVERTTPAKAPVLVVLAAREGAQGSPYVYDLLPGGGSYHLVAEPGSYRIFAFEDLDSDFRYDEGEPAGELAGGPLDARTHAPDLATGRIRLEVGGWASDSPVELHPAWRGSGADRGSNLGRIVDLDDPAFAPSEVSNGIWEPMTFLRDHGLGIYFLEPYDPQRLPVLLVHGMGGSPRDFRAVVAHLDRTRYQPWLYFYPTGLSLRFSSWGLDRLLRELEARLGVERIALVAHSMGGLVSRGALNLRQQAGDPPLVGPFVTISTPWTGHAGAQMGTHAPTVAPSWRDMAPGSEYQREALATPLAAGIEHTLFFGYHAGKVATGSGDGTISVASELPLEVQEGAARIRGFDETHESILESPEMLALLDRALAAPEAP